jgi:hypothetical protein
MRGFFVFYLELSIFLLYYAISKPVLQNSKQYINRVKINLDFSIFFLTFVSET